MTCVKLTRFVQFTSAIPLISNDDYKQIRERERGMMTVNVTGCHTFAFPAVTLRKNNGTLYYKTNVKLVLTWQGKTVFLFFSYPE